MLFVLTVQQNCSIDMLLSNFTEESFEEFSLTPRFRQGMTEIVSQWKRSKIFWFLVNTKWRHLHHYLRVCHYL